MTALGLGVLGMGDLARNVYLPKTREAEARGAIRLAAVNSRSSTARDWMAKHYPEVIVHVDYQAMLDDPCVDMVVNLTPTPAHASWNETRLGAG